MLFNYKFELQHNVSWHFNNLANNVKHEVFTFLI